MALYVDNITSEALNVSFLTYDPGCAGSGQPWRKRAWWVIPPGATIIPNILDVDLNSVNRYVYFYAYTESRDKNWQGTGRAWFEVSGGVHFDQCGEDEADCVDWVDFEEVDLAGHGDDILYIGPSASEMKCTVPEVTSLVGSEGQFTITGTGFSSGTTVSIVHTYVADGDETQGTTTAETDGYGSFRSTVDLPTLLYAGTLNADCVDERFGALKASRLVAV